QSRVESAHSLPPNLGRDRRPAGEARGDDGQAQGQQPIRTHQRTPRVAGTQLEHAAPRQPPACSTSFKHMFGDLAGLSGAFRVRAALARRDMGVSVAAALWGVMSVEGVAPFVPNRRGNALAAYRIEVRGVGHVLRLRGPDEVVRHLRALPPDLPRYRLG